MTVRLRELTPAGTGAITVVELRGGGLRSRLAALGVRLPVVGRPAVVRLVEEGEGLDEALCVALGEEHAELHLHGSPAVLACVRKALAAQPWPSSGSLEERAEETLAEARSEAAARMLLDQAEGALRRALEGLDPADERAFQAGLDELQGAARVARVLVRPPRVLLAGPTNAGKSTLFNLLLGTERVVVAAAAGTTRDAILEPARLGAYALELGDLAGERGLADGGSAAWIEAAGQRRARELARAAELVLWLRPCPGLAEPPAPDPHARGVRRVVVSRCDLGGETPLPAGVPALSARADPEGARRQVRELFHAALGLPAEPWTPGRAAPFDPADAARLEALRSAPPARRAEELDLLLAR